VLVCICLTGLETKKILVWFLQLPSWYLEAAYLEAAIVIIMTLSFHMIALLSSVAHNFINAVLLVLVVILLPLPLSPLWGSASVHRYLGVVATAATTDVLNITSANSSPATLVNLVSLSPRLRQLLYKYVEQFNSDDLIDDNDPNRGELYQQYIPNREALPFLRDNIPLFSCPDEDIERAYYFRWWTYRKHIKYVKEAAPAPDVGIANTTLFSPYFVITEFLPRVSWAGLHNTISCAAGHHFREGRWLHNETFLDDYARFWA
jgi:hypothetical protein